MKISPAQQEDRKVTHLIFADNCYLLASTNDELCRMIKEATVGLTNRGLDWKKDEMEFMAWSVEGGGAGSINLQHEGHGYEVREVKAMKAVEALITSEADSMSALRLRMGQADKALWADMKFYKNKGISEGKKHGRYRVVVQACILHSCEGWN